MKKIGTITFEFKSNVSEELVTKTLEEIEGWHAVVRASRLSPDATDPEVRKMAFADVNLSASSTVLEKLRQLNTISQSSIPPLRKLIK